MFLADLGLSEKLAFVQLSNEMVTVDDGKVDVKEDDMIYSMLNEMQLTKSDVVSIEFNLDQLADRFKSGRAKRICIAELYSLTFCHEKIHQKQQHLLDSLALFFEISSQEVDKIKNWVERSMELMHEGFSLMEGGE
ncbi:MAG: hypothetical protein AB7E96_11720 [Deferribacterales bacterium]